MQASLPPLLLASSSPRRRQLLADAGYTFTVRASDAAEEFDADTPSADVPVLLAERKARALYEYDATHLVIAADTVVLLGNEVINKPADLADAFAMLQRLSGQQHSVITGVALYHAQRLHTFAERTEVYFRHLAYEEIQHYLANYTPLDKAGAYGVQEYIGLRGVQRIEGDFYNVMGLPVCRLSTELPIFMQQFV